METEKGCIKCGSRDAVTEEVAMTGSGLSKLFDVQHQKFQIVYRKSCGYTELYKADSSMAGNVIDFFFGG